MTSPICTVNGGSTANGVNVSLSTLTTIALADPAGVRTWEISIIGSDELVVVPTLTIDPVTKTATFTSSSSLGTALIFQSRVNSGLGPDNQPDASLTTTFGVYTLTGTGTRVGATNESVEGSAQFGWITKMNPLFRSGGSAPTGSAGGDLSGSYPNPTVALISGATGNFTWASTATSPKLSMATHATTPQTLTVQAANVTTGTGSTLNLKSGAGSVANGGIRLSAGGNDLVSFSDTAGQCFMLIDSTRGGMTIQANAAGQFFQLSSTGVGNAIYMTSPALFLRSATAADILYFSIDTVCTATLGSTVSAFQWGQTAKASGVGAQTAFTAQNSTSGTGGKFVVSSGDGGAVAGNVELQTGGVAKLTVTPTLTTSVNDISIGANTVSSGALRLANAAYIKSQLVAGTTVSLFQVDGADNISFGDYVNGPNWWIVANGPGHFQTADSPSTNIAAHVFKGTSFEFNSGGAAQTFGLVFNVATTTPTISQTARASDAATSNLTLTPQAAFSTATGTNRIPGSLVVSLGAPTNSGTTEGRLTVKRAGTGLASLGGLDNQAGAFGALWLGPVTPTGTNYTITSDGANAMYFNGALGSTAMVFAFGGTASLAMIAGAMYFDTSVTAPLISQTARTSDAACANLTITPQAAFSTATGTNRKSGDLVVALSAPTNSGTSEARFSITRAGTQQASIGCYDTSLTTYSAVWLGNGAPSSTNCTFLGDGSANSYLSVPASGTVGFIFGANSAAAGSLLLTAAAGLQFSTITTAAGLMQSAVATNSATGATLTIQAQNATGTTSTGGNLNLKSGTGTTANGVVQLMSGSNARATVNNAELFTSTGINVSIGGTGSYGGGLSVLCIKSNTAPTSNPSGGHVIYVDPADNKLKSRGPSGTITTIATP